jgi:hypothetical protein
MRPADCLALSVTVNTALSRSLTAHLQHSILNTTTIESARFSCHLIVVLIVTSCLQCICSTLRLRALHPLSLCARHSFPPSPLPPTLSRAQQNCYPHHYRSSANQLLILVAIMPKEVKARKAKSKVEGKRKKGKGLQLASFIQSSFNTL